MAQEFEIRVISLLNQTDRRERIVRIFDGQSVDWSFFNAIPGHAIADFLKMYDRKKRLQYLGYDLRDNEIACFLSHRKIWEECVQKNKPFLVLEDDVKICEQMQNFSQVAECVDFLIHSIHSHFLFIRLGNLFQRKFQRIKTVKDGLTVVRYHRDPSTAMAYIISPDVAKRLLSNSRSFFCAVDNYMWRGWEHGCCLLDLSPALFFTSDADTPSTIGDRSKPAMGFFRKIKREFYRAVDANKRSNYEKSIVQYLVKNESKIFK